jgi:hypothetical protein
MLNFRKTLFIMLAFALPSQPLLAAPFCVQTQTTPQQCDYFDAAQCRTRAAELNGYCVANPGELVISPGGTGRYCLVLSSRHTQCLYADRTSCEKDAVSANGVCMENAPASVQEDPYRYDINRKY